MSGGGQQGKDSNASATTSKPAVDKKNFASSLGRIMEDSFKKSNQQKKDAEKKQQEQNKHADDDEDGGVNNNSQVESNADGFDYEDGFDFAQIDEKAGQMQEFTDSFTKFFS